MNESVSRQLAANQRQARQAFWHVWTYVRRRYSQYVCTYVIAFWIASRHARMPPRQQSVHLLFCREECRARLVLSANRILGLIVFFHLNLILRGLTPKSQYNCRYGPIKTQEEVEELWRAE